MGFTVTGVIVVVILSMVNEIDNFEMCDNKINDSVVLDNTYHSIAHVIYWCCVPNLAEILDKIRSGNETKH